MSVITFTDIAGVDAQYEPTPASRMLPDWYKQAESYINGHRVITDGNTPHTIKKCVPVFDALTAGYILRTYVDVQVTERNGGPWYEWPMHDAISMHAVEQAPTHPAHNGMPYPKWRNPWAIKTAPGYSCLFLPPMHNPNGLFTILPGVVDTDTYASPVNFPFVLDDVKWQGIIPAGTPMAQVIPFRRDTFRMALGGDKERRQQARADGRLRSLWFNSYKRQFWTRKEYK